MINLSLMKKRDVKKIVTITVNTIVRFNRTLGNEAQISLLPGWLYDLRVGGNSSSGRH